MALHTPIIKTAYVLKVRKSTLSYWFLIPYRKKIIIEKFTFCYFANGRFANFKFRLSLDF